MLALPDPTLPLAVQVGRNTEEIVVLRRDVSGLKTTTRNHNRRLRAAERSAARQTAAIDDLRSVVVESVVPVIASMQTHIDEARDERARADAARKEQAAALAAITARKDSRASSTIPSLLGSLGVIAAIVWGSLQRDLSPLLFYGVSLIAAVVVIAIILSIRWPGLGRS